MCVCVCVFVQCYNKLPRGLYYNKMPISNTFVLKIAEQRSVAASSRSGSLDSTPPV